MLSNALELLDLSKRVQDMVAARQITVGHARVLQSIEKADEKNIGRQSV